MEEKRKLPSWMMGVKKDENNSSNNNSVSKALDLDDVVNKDEDVSKFVKPKAKRVVPRKKFSNEKAVLVKCETKRKKRGLVEEDVIECDGFEGGGVVERRKHGWVGRKGGDNGAVGGKEDERCEFDGGNEDKDLYPSCGEEDDDVDVDLTMEDLLSIAKEFVENDKRDLSQKKRAEEHCKLKSDALYTSLDKTRNSLLASQDTTSHMHEETTSHHDCVENTASEVTLPDFQMTEDSTQDMLNLFLGPLLMKPIAKEDPRPVKNISISHEIKNQLNEAVISDKPVTVTKKKSRLREAVAMLLDCET
uniref:uncharacterized protein LOC122579294 n=1 Tax=Erigeron canadensis TaxID=72917 RepID=UPI001CB89D1E|nr:uncharacterized protein LOC122579294 [Erigeron canadensis]